jgi:hypothetical protein
LPTVWLRNKHLAERYGCSIKSIERARRYGRLPPPKYPFGNRNPANTLEELEQHDRAMTMGGRTIYDEALERLYQEISVAATRAEAEAVVHNFDLDQLSEIQRENVQQHIADLLKEF